MFDAALYRRVLTKGSLGLGEAYMDGMWDVCTMDEFFHKLLSSDIDRKLGHKLRLRLLGPWQAA